METCGLRERSECVPIRDFIIQLCFVEYKYRAKRVQMYSSHSSRPREVQNLGKSEFWEKKSLDNKSLIRRFGV